MKVWAKAEAVGCLSRAELLGGLKVGNCGESKIKRGLPQWLSGKEFTCSAGVEGDAGLIPGLGFSSSLFLFWSLYSVLRKSFRIKTKNKLPVSDATAPTTLSFWSIHSQIYGRSRCLHFVTIQSFLKFKLHMILCFHCVTNQRICNRRKLWSIIKMNIYKSTTQPKN